MSFLPALAALALAGAVAAQDPEQQGDVLVTLPVEEPPCREALAPEKHDICDRIEAEQAIAADIRARSRAFSDAYIAGDVEALLDIYTGDAVAIAGPGNSMQGRFDLRNYWTLPEGVKIVRHQMESGYIDVKSDVLAVAHGDYFGQLERADGTSDTFSGVYLAIWEKGQDGLWRMSYDMWAARR